jgi:hypothetical protein
MGTTGLAVVLAGGDGVAAAIGGDEQALIGADIDRRARRGLPRRVLRSFTGRGPLDGQC